MCGGPGVCCLSTWPGHGPGRDRSVWATEDYSAWLISSVQLLSHVRLFATPWTAAHQASLSIANSWSSPKLMSIESVMPSNHLILCCPLLFRLQSFPASVSFQMSQFFASGGQRIGVSASASVLPKNIQDGSSLGWTGWISCTSLAGTGTNRARIIKYAVFRNPLSPTPFFSPSLLCYLNGQNLKE